MAALCGHARTLSEAVTGCKWMPGFMSRKDVLKALVHEPPLDLWS